MAKTKHSALFEKYAQRYARGGCRKDQLARLVEYNAITAAEYKEITGEELE